MMRNVLFIIFVFVPSLMIGQKATSLSFQIFDSDSIPVQVPYQLQSEDGTNFTAVNGAIFISVLEFQKYKDRSFKIEFTGKWTKSFCYTSRLYYSAFGYVNDEGIDAAQLKLSDLFQNSRKLFLRSKKNNLNPQH